MTQTIVRELDWSLGDRFAKARKHAKLDQQAVAAHLGVTHGAVAQWETNRTKPRDLLTVAERYEEITGVSRWWILGAPTYSAWNISPSHTPRLRRRAAA